MSYDVETMPYHGGSRGGFGAFPPRLCHAPTVIATLVARDHLPTTDDLEFVEMAGGGEGLICHALCTNSNLYLGPSRSNDE